MARVQLSEAIFSIGANRTVSVPASGSVTVYERGGTALASVYSAATGGAALPNPRPVTDGYATGYVDMGSYDLVASANGESSERVEWEASRADSVERREEAAWVSAKRFGLVDGLTDTVTRNKLEDAIEGAASAGVGLIVPYNTVGDADWQIDGPLTLDAPGARVRAVGGIEQATWGETVFDVIDDAVGAEVVFRRVVGQRGTFAGAGGSSAYRGDQAYLGACAVYCTADHAVIRGYASGFVAAVVATAWNGTALNARQVDGMTVQVVCDDVDFGLLAMGQRGIDFDMRGSYALSSGSSNPPHLVYFSNNVSSTRSEGVVGRGHGWDGVGGHAFQLKGVDGALVKLSSNACEGLLSLNDVTDIVVPGWVAVADAASNGTLYLQDGTDRVSIGPGRVQLAAASRALRIADDTSQITVDGMSVEVADSAGGDEYFALVEGVGHRINRFRINNSGTTGRRGIYVENATDVHIIDPELKTVRQGVAVASSATGTVIDVDRDKITLNASNLGYTADSGVGTINRDLDREHVFSGWVTHAAQTKTLGVVKGPIKVHAVEVYVHEAFNSDGTDNLTVGHDSGTSAWMGVVDVATTGDKTPAAGSAASYRSSTSTTIKAYYANGGTEPTTGKALVKIRFSYVDGTP